MMRSLILFVVLTVSHSSIPPNFKRCNRKDVNFKKCYYEAAQYGVSLLTRPYKELNLPTVDPMDIPSLTVEGTGGAVAVDQHFKNCKIHGLSTTKFDRFELDFEKNTLDSHGIIEKVTFECQYKIDGKVLILPVQGEGDSIVKFTNLEIKFHADFNQVVRGGKTYFETLKSDLDGSVGHMYMHFDNLFNGNKQLGDNINNVINDNWEQIYAELKPVYIKIIRQVLVGIMDKIWDVQSLEEYFD